MFCGNQNSIGKLRDGHFPQIWGNTCALVSNDSLQHDKSLLEDINSVISFIANRSGFGIFILWQRLWHRCYWSKQNLAEISVTAKARKRRSTGLCHSFYDHECLFQERQHLHTERLLIQPALKNQITCCRDTAHNLSCMTISVSHRPYLSSYNRGIHVFQTAFLDKQWKKAQTHETKSLYFWQVTAWVRR